MREIILIICIRILITKLLPKEHRLHFAYCNGSKFEDFFSNQIKDPDASLNEYAKPLFDELIHNGDDLYRVLTTLPSFMCFKFLNHHLDKINTDKQVELIEDLLPENDKRLFAEHYDEIKKSFVPLPSGDSVSNRNRLFTPNSEQAGEAINPPSEVDDAAKDASSEQFKMS